MTQATTPQNVEQANEAADPGSQELSDAELDGVVGGTGALVHEPVHAGTTPSTPPPRTGTTVPVRPPRSPPTGFP